MNVINNAIPRECAITFTTTSELKDLQEVVNEYQEYFDEEFMVSDPDIKLELTINDKIGLQALSVEESKDIIRLLVVLKNGFVERSLVIDDLTTISLNMGVVMIENNQLKIDYLLRSPMKTKISLGLQYSNKIF